MSDEETDWETDWINNWQTDWNKDLDKDKAMQEEPYFMPDLSKSLLDHAVISTITLHILYLNVFF
jgi:hypothetical protein